MTSKTDIPSSSFSAPTFRKLTYDVFLSFRGEDTRKNFTDHLYSALKDKGIITFRDDEELERGESIAPNLLKAIEQSRCAVVVLSRNYADSPWCLDEMAKIVECMKAMGQKVLPVFYDVDPSEARHQKGDHFGKAFAKHQKRFEGNPDKVKTWKDALSQVANLSGWPVQDREASWKIRYFLATILIRSDGNTGRPKESKAIITGVVHKWTNYDKDEDICGSCAERHALLCQDSIVGEEEEEEEALLPGQQRRRRQWRGLGRRRWLPA